MAIEQELNSLPQLFKLVKGSRDAGLKRDFLADTRFGMERLGIEVPTPVCLENPIPDRPTLVVANHFVRPLIHRRQPFTTIEAIVTTGIITHGMEQLVPNKRLEWMAQGDLPPKKILSLSLGDREMQKAAIECYNHIPVSSDPELAFATIKEVKDRLLSGVNVGVYPEGGVKYTDALTRYKMGVFQAEFGFLLLSLQRNRVDFQILPTTVYEEDSQYNLTFGKVIQPGRCRETVKKIQAAILAPLPPRMHGRGGVDPYIERDRRRGRIPSTV